jgi:AraC-like DNA-binding protein
MGKFLFLRSFRRVLGLTPHQWLMQQRLRDAAQGLRERPHDSVSTVAFDAGFGDLSTFNALFRRVFGATPSAWRLQR